MLRFTQHPPDLRLFVYANAVQSGPALTEGDVIARAGGLRSRSTETTASEATASSS